MSLVQRVSFAGRVEADAREQAEGVNTLTKSNTADSSAASTCAGSELLSPRSERSSDSFEGVEGCSPEETLIVFDWDDTILPTSWLDKRGLLKGNLGVPSKEQKTCLLALTKSSAKMLEAALQFGTVMIITNGTDGWVERTCDRFMPEIGHLLERCCVLSARAVYGKLAPTTPSEWKRHAFEAEISKFLPTMPEGGRANLLSLGDSHHEYFAMRNAALSVPDCLVKCCKFATKPHVPGMLREQNFVAQFLEEMVLAGDSLDVNISVSVEEGSLACFPRCPDKDIVAYYQAK